MRKAIVKITFDNEKVAKVVHKAISLEEIQDFKRVKVNLERQSNILTIKINASDTTALRAAFNSYMRWVKVCLSVINLM